MSTTQKTDSSNESSLQFNPKSQSIYDSMTKSGGDVLKGYMDNPFGNASYNMGLGQSMKGAAQGGNNNMQSLLQMMKTQGIGGTAGQGFQSAMMGQTGRANQSMMADANTSNVMAAMQRQMQATGMGMSFSPQLTGQTGKASQTQTTGGLGTWLPQLLGSAAGAAMGGLTGGASSVMGSFNPSKWMGGPSSAPGQGPAMPPPFSPMNLPSGSVAPPPAWLGGS